MYMYMNVQTTADTPCYRLCESTANLLKAALAKAEGVAQRTTLTRLKAEEEDGKEREKACKVATQGKKDMDTKPVPAAAAPPSISSSAFAGRAPKTWTCRRDLVRSMSCLPLEIRSCLLDKTNIRTGTSASSMGPMKPYRSIERTMSSFAMSSSAVGGGHASIGVGGIGVGTSPPTKLLAPAVKGTMLRRNYYRSLGIR